ncbi:beta-lactamase class A [Streptomyces sp. HCCB10043]|nr:beta-lactamase class A [Streptomyces sp. HCCB10043]
MATMAPPSPNSKASGKANISEPTAASMTMGASCQIRSLRVGRSSTSTSGVTSCSSGPSGLSRPAVSRGDGTSCSVSRCSVSRGPASIATRPPNSDSTGSMLDDGTVTGAELTGGASRCHHVIRL